MAQSLVWRQEGKRGENEDDWLWWKLLTGQDCVTKTALKPGNILGGKHIAALNKSMVFRKNDGKKAASGFCNNHWYFHYIVYSVTFYIMPLEYTFYYPDELLPRLNLKL